MQHWDLVRKHSCRAVTLPAALVAVAFVRRQATAAALEAGAAAVHVAVAKVSAVLVSVEAA